MGIAFGVVMCSNCIKCCVGVVIVCDWCIVFIGYNGIFRGVFNCNEGGCFCCNFLVFSGTCLEECLCFYVEENVII